jgi:hypothetical protein
MILKRPIDSHRLRSTPPAGFGWIDHRFLRGGYFQRCSLPALALYSLLVCAGDAQGLSFYSEARAAELLGLEVEAVRRARRELIEAQLIAFQKPLYQVLALEDAARPSRAGARPPSAAQDTAAASRPPSPPRKRLAEPPSPPLRPAPPGLDLCALVKASLQKGGAQ